VQSLLDDSTSPASSSAQIAASVDSGSVTGTQKRQPSNGTQASSPPAQSPASSILREGAQPSQVSNVTVSDNNGIPATTENALPSLLQDQIFTFPESAVEASAMSATVGGEIDPNRLSEFLSSQDFNHFAAYNGQDGGFPMDKEPEWTIGLGDDFPMMDNNSAPWAETPLMNPHMSRAGVSQAGTVSSSTSIPDRRLARIERLWSKKGGRPWRLMQSLWADVTAHGRDNILSTVASSTLEFENSARRFTLNGIDDERRSSFIEEFSVPNTPVVWATIDAFLGPMILSFVVNRKPQ
jgi:hypothetical protein